MVDEKVCNILTETKSSQSYNLCGATPKIMNSIDELLLRPITEEALEFGLSTLHAYIRFMEWLLYVSYRLDIKVWQVTSVLIISFFVVKCLEMIQPIKLFLQIPGTKREEVNARQRAIQQRFRSETGLLIDVGKQGHGTTNDGNTARRFF